MPITRDADFPVEIAKLVQAFNKCADGHKMLDVLEAAGNMLSASLHNYAAAAGMSDKAFEGLARMTLDGVLRSAEFNWRRSSKSSDIPVAHQ